MHRDKLKAIVISAALILGLCPVTKVKAIGPHEPEALDIAPIRVSVNSEDTTLLRLTHSLNLAADITVAPGGSVQSALNNANCGDTIMLQAGTAYNANLTYSKACASPITIQSSRVNELPIGIRVTPAQSSLLAKLQSTTAGEPIIKTALGAKGLRLIGLEITTQSASISVFDLVRFGEGSQTQATTMSVPSDILIDRSYIHGWPTQDAQRGVAMNCANCEVSNSSITDVHWRGQDSQAIGGWNGSNGVRIINNFLAAAGENIMFGGALSASEALMPANIEIRRNHLFKPLTWKVGDPTYAGIHWAIKNLLELKQARNVVIDSNVLENCWTDAQIGYAVLFTVRGEEGRNPWATIANVSFTNNVVKNSEQGFQLLGLDNGGASQRASGLTISNNLFPNIANRFLTMTGGYLNVTFEHNTHFQGGNIMTFDGPLPASGFVYRNNVTIRDPRGFGIFGSGVGEGTAALEKYTPGYDMAGNAIAGLGTLTRLYPLNNFYPADLSTLPTLKGTDGLVPGYREPAQPTPTPSVTPTPAPSATPVPSPSVTPTPSPSPLLPRVLTVTFPLTDEAGRSKQIEDVEKNQNVKFINCSGNTCYFARRP